MVKFLTKHRSYFKTSLFARFFSAPRAYISGFETSYRVLFLIFLLALFLRVYKLADFPVGFHADEVRVGWQAAQGKLLPLYFNTFGDFRPTGIFYTAMPSITIFGKNEFAVRFPSALFGALTIFSIYFFTQGITKSKKIALFSSLLLAISPWHLAVSRATSEAVIALFLTLCALYFCIKRRLFLTLFFTLISYFFYHSTRVLAPIFLGIMAFYRVTEDYLFNSGRKIFTYAATAALLLTFIFSLHSGARGRLSQVSISKDPDIKYELANAQDFINNKAIIYSKRFVNEYAKYFGADFLIGYGARPYRYITPGVGLLTYMEFFLFVVGLVQIARKKESALPLLLLLVAPLPAAITTEDSPNLMRGLYMIPFVSIIGAYGLQALGNNLKKPVFVLLILNFAFFVYMYFVHSAVHRPLVANADMDASSYRNIGTKELAKALKQVQGDYEKIIVTGFPDNVRPWYEFFVGEVPENIYFTDLKCASDDSFVEENPEKLLAVDSWECSPESKIKDGLPIKIINKILRPNGSEVFVFVTRQE